MCGRDKVALRAVVGVTLEGKGQLKAKERKEKRRWQHELNSSVARPRKHGEVVLRRCSAIQHATTIKWSLHLVHEALVVLSKGLAEKTVNTCVGVTMLL